MFLSFLKRNCIGLILAACFFVPSVQIFAEELTVQAEKKALIDEELDEVIEVADNPVAKKLALGFENILSKGIKPGDKTHDQLSIKGLFPTKHDDWWLVHRPVLPVLYKQEMSDGEGSVTGLGDLSYRLYFSPRERDDIIWGIGPVFIFPTATDSRLGAGKWSIGPTIGFVTRPGKWSFGLVALNVWSVAGESERPSVNVLEVIPIFNYVFGNGWFIGSSPEIFADWNADKNNRWLVPLGAGIGKAFKMGDQAIAFRIGGYYNVERPVGASEWNVRISLNLLFKKMKKGRK
jgi:hypothetical protein